MLPLTFLFESNCILVVIATSFTIPGVSLVIYDPLLEPVNLQSQYLTSFTSAGVSFLISDTLLEPLGLPSQYPTSFKNPWVSLVNSDLLLDLLSSDSTVTICELFTISVTHFQSPGLVSYPLPSS